MKHNYWERLNRIEAKLDELLQEKKQTQNWYSTAEVAAILGKATWTIRQHCRLGRIHARKKQCGRGTSKEWMIAHEELERIKSEGLLPLSKF